MDSMSPVSATMVVTSARVSSWLAVFVRFSSAIVLIGVSVGLGLLCERVGENNGFEANALTDDTKKRTQKIQTKG